MRSKTYLFSPGLSRNILSRFWPLWLIYLGMLLMQLPFTASEYLTPEATEQYIASRILGKAVGVAGNAMIASVLSVMAAFSYLYSKRSCSLINSMPIRRETAFVTACLTGLLPLLLAEVLTWLISLGIFAGSEMVWPEWLNSWLLAALLSTLASYGFGVFCAMLTGHILVVPALFLVLNVAVIVLDGLIQSMLVLLVYGYDSGNLSISWLSPLVYMMERLRVNTYSGAASALKDYGLEGLDALGVYAAVGVLFIGLALLIYRRRKMECVGDVVAIKALRPVFKYCSSVYAALGLGVLLSHMLFDLRSGNAAVTALLLVIGAALGYYAAEMLLQKSLSVFRSRVRGLLIVWAVLLLSVAAIEFDLTGYERRVPEPEEIQSAMLVNDWRSSDDPEIIEFCRRIHQTAIDNKDHNKKAEYSAIIHIEYSLKDGSTLSRSYSVDRSRDWVDNSGSSEYAMVRELYLLPQSKEILNETEGEIKAEYIVDSDIQKLLPRSDEYSSSYEYIELSPQQAEELYTQCILPDIKDSSLGNQWFYMDEEAYETWSNVSFDISLKKPMEGEPYNEFSYWVGVDITLDAERTIAWLEENLGIEVKPYLEVRPDALEDLEYY